MATDRRQQSSPAHPTWRSAAALWGALLVALLVIGCGGSGAKGSASTTTSPSGQPGHLHRGLPPALGATPRPPIGRRPDPRGVMVIKNWSNALRRGDVRAAAAYFALPSQFINGIGTGRLEQVIRIHTRAQAEAVNSSLPCGARFISAHRRGGYINALFRLTGRSGPGGSDCGGGAGHTARTNFLIVHGHIVQWIRAPDEPGDNHTPAAPPSSGPTPVV